MSYQVEFTATAVRHLKAWNRSGQKSILSKINDLVKELKVHPKTGTGHPEQLRGDYAGLWSRAIDKKNRLVYFIEEQVVTVTIISLLGHYSDK